MFLLNKLKNLSFIWHSRGFHMIVKWQLNEGYIFYFRLREITILKGEVGKNLRSDLILADRFCKENI